MQHGIESAPPQAGDKALFLIETPFQLLCAYEQIAEYKLDYTLAMRMTGVGRGDEQIREMAGILGLKFSEYTVRVGHHRIDTITALPKLATILARRYDHLFLGSYFSRFLMTVRRAVRASHVWLLDDGLATFLAQDRMKETGGKPYNLATFFKVPPLAGQGAIYHDFRQLAALKEAVYTDEALFIGQPLAELDYISHDDYHKVLTFASKDSGARMMYIPHRRETANHVDSVKKEFDVKVVYIATCIELHFARNGAIPSKIYTCLSTAAFSLAALFPRSTVTMLPSSMVDGGAHVPAVLEYAKNIPNMRLAGMDQ